MTGMDARASARAGEALSASGSARGGPAGRGVAPGGVELLMSPSVNPTPPEDARRRHPIVAVALALLRPVRGHDAVAVERESPLVLLLLFLIPLATPPAAALSERLALWALPGGRALRWAGVALSGAGLALRIAAMAQLGSRFSPRVAMQREHTLETRGLYARVRHPGYAGAWLAALGGALAFGSAVTLPLVLAMGALLWRRAAREESMLERHFGDAYRSYRDRTGRFVPRLVPSRTPPA